MRNKYNSMEIQLDRREPPQNASLSYLYKGVVSSFRVRILASHQLIAHDATTLAQPIAKAFRRDLAAVLISPDPQQKVTERRWIEFARRIGISKLDDACDRIRRIERNPVIEPKLMKFGDQQQFRILG